jgi:hypothetical protein|tara:strand:- start:1857 stop:2297 length:441 start_codon:yes stop_codon:yes gene_type:complete
MGSWDTGQGLNAVGAYQVSGRPFASGSVNALLGARPGGHEIVFPYVTRWFKVVNNDPLNDCKIAFSLSGMTGSNNYFTVPSLSGSISTAFGNTSNVANSGVLEMKVSSIWVSGSTNVDIVAGLTSIATIRTATTIGPNWSGSAGVG